MWLRTRIAVLAVIVTAPLATAATATASPAGAASVPGRAALWAARYPAAGSSPASVAISPDGSRVFVTGSLGFQQRTSNFATVAYDAATGARLWLTRYRGLGYGGPADIAVSPDGTKVFVTGFTTEQGACCPDWLTTVAYDAVTGRILWTHRLSDPSRGESVVVSPDGATVFVTGGVENHAGTEGYLVTLAYDAATGSRLWAARYPRPLSGIVQSAAVSPSGQTLFAGGVVTDAAGSAFILTLARDAATGETRWARLQPGGDNTGAHVAASPDGSAVYVTATAPGASGGSSIVTLGYGAENGERLWSRAYSGGTAGSGANAIAVSPDGQRVYVAGYAGTSDTAVVDFATLAYDSDGHQAWVSRYGTALDNGLLSKGAIALGVSPDGREVYVTGHAAGSARNSLSMATFGYDATSGQALWLARYAGPRDYAYPSALAVSPDGQRVVVTGSTFGNQPCCGAVTVAYAP